MGDGVVFNRTADEMMNLAAINKAIEGRIITFCSPEVKKISEGAQPINWAMLRRDFSKTALADRPAAWMDEGLPWVWRICSSIDAITSG